jgi:ABC-type amino acid transport substrate-binding protein
MNMYGFVVQRTYFQQSQTGLLILIRALHLLLILNAPCALAETVDSFSHHKDQSPLRVVLQDRKPLGFFHEGKLRGLLVELLNQVGLSQNIALDIQLAPYARAYQMMQAAKSDVTVTYDFIAAHVESSGAAFLPFTKDLKTSLYALKNNDIEIHQPSDLKDVSIGIARIMVPMQDKGLSALGANVLLFKSGLHLLKALKAGRVSLIVVLDDTFSINAKTMGIHLRQVYQMDKVPDTNGSVKLVFWFNGATLGSATEDFCQRFKQGIINLKKTKVLNKIYIEQYQYALGDSLMLSGSSNNPLVCIGQKELMKR